MLQQQFQKFLSLPSINQSLSSSLHAFRQQINPDALIVNLRADLCVALQFDPVLAHALILSFGNADLQNLFQV